MKIRLSPNLACAFTLAEIMCAMALFILMVACVFSSHLMGLRMFNLTATKLAASSGARAAINHVRDDIRSGKILDVGNASDTTFTNIPGGNLQMGNALTIYPTTDTNNWIRYWVNATDKKLKRKASGSTNVDVIANFLTNTVAFRAEDYQGNTLANDQNNRIVRMTLEFYQWEFPVAGIGAYYDYYRLQTRMTRRAIE